MKIHKKVMKYLNKKSTCQDIIKRIINEELIIRPFQEARIERAKEVILKKKNYYRSHLSKSVKASNINWPYISEDTKMFEQSFHVSMYDPANIEKRYCPPIQTPQSSLGNKTQMKFSDYIQLQNEKEAL